jgi:hypothetical protein
MWLDPEYDRRLVGPCPRTARGTQQTKAAPNHLDSVVMAFDQATAAQIGAWTLAPNQPPRNP